MKKLITITCSLLLFFTINAQIIEELEYFNDIDSVMVNIDKTNFTSNILYDRTSSDAKLQTFNTLENNISNVTHFEQAFSELYKASKHQKFTTIENLRNEYSFDKNTVEIGIINTKFHNLNYNKEDEELGGLVYDSISKKLTEIPNKQFFTSKNALVIAPLKKNAVGETINFVFKNELLFEENNSKTIENLTVNFGDNQTHAIISNGSIIQNTIPINYSTNGNKTIVFNATFSDGTTKTTNGQLYVKIALPSNGLIPVVASIPFQGYEETIPILGFLNYRTFYSDPNNETLLKPIIIIDGFDPQDKRKLIRSDMDDPTDFEQETLEELMVYVPNEGGNPVPIIPLLNAEGYDVILVNHPNYQRNINGVLTPIDGGADYIERNAMTHIRLYQILNEELATNGSSEELVIVGPSMGGQISRYALAYMEKEYQENPTEHQWNHNTRLWVSLDSPHQGANIPMGAQANIYFLGYRHGSQNAKDQYDKSIKSIAARQQLVLQFNSSTYSVPSLFNTYYTNLSNNGLPNSNGYPQNLRKIAMVNGSLCSQKNGFASQEVLDIRAFTEILWFDHKAFQNQIWYINHTGQSNQIYYGMVDKVIESYSYSVSFTNNNPKGAIDMLAGGYFDTQGILKTQIMEELNNDDNIDDVSLRTYLPNHNFVPTHSALDTNGFLNWYQLIDEDLVASSKTPFDSYFGEVDNTNHVSFTQASKDWLFEELDNNTQNPPVFTSCDPVSNIIITGPDTLCGTDQATYSTNYANGGIFHDWFVDGFLIISENNGYITLQRDPDYSPNYSTLISVTVNGGNVPGTKTLTCSPPQFDITYNDNNISVEIILSDVENETPLSQQAITDVDWELTSGNSYILNATTEQAVFDETYFTGTVTATNAAGSTTKTYFWPDPNICYSIVKLSADKYQVIDRCNYNEAISTMSLKEIYDIHGNKIADLPINYEELDLVNTGNTGDIRIIRVIINGEQVTKTVFKD